MRSLSKSIAAGLVFGTTLLLALPALGAETSNSEFLIVQPDDVVDDDLYVGAIKATIQGRVDGDLIVFATEEVIIDGEVTGSVLAVAPSVTVRGTVGRSLRVSASKLTVSGDVGRDVVGVAYSIELNEDSTVGKDVEVWAWRTKSFGAIGRDLRGTHRNLELAGSIGRDVEVSVTRLTVVGDLEVEGDLGYRSSLEADGLENADVNGVIVQKSPLAPNIRVRALGVLGRFLVVLFLTISALATAWGWPDQTRRAVAAVGESITRSWAWGVSVFLAPVVLGAIALLLLSLAPSSASLPLMAVIGPVILAVIGVLFAMSLVAGVPAVGRLGNVLFKNWDVYGALLAASLLVGVLWVLPVVGWVLPALILPTGLGGWIRGWRAGRLQAEVPV